MNALKPWHIVVLLVVILLLFGARRLPDLARSVGESLRIFKREVKDLQDDDDRPVATTPPPVVTPVPGTNPVAGTNPVPPASTGPVVNPSPSAQPASPLDQPGTTQPPASGGTTPSA